MGILDFLKKLSSKEKEEPEEKELNLEELTTFLNSKSKKTLEKTNTEIKNIKQEIEGGKNNLNENIHKLKEATLRNPNIPERAKHIMEGNRTTYAQNSNKIIEKTKIPEKFEEIHEFCDSFNNLLNNFSKTTARSYMIMQEFFGDESNAISLNIRNLDISIKKLKKTVEDSGIEKLKELKYKITELQRKTKLKEELKEKIEKAKEELQKTNKKSEETKNNIKKLEEGKEYKELLEVTNKKNETQQEKENKEKQILNSFNTIETALKKYERLTLENQLVKKYLENPIKALLEDDNLKITELAEKMKESITKGELELKEKKKNKITQELDKLNKNHFETFLSQYHELNKKLNDLKKEEEEETNIKKEIEELKEKLQKNYKKTEEEKHQIETIQKNLESINIEKFKENLEKDIKTTTKEKVRITLN